MAKAVNTAAAKAASQGGLHPNLAQIYREKIANLHTAQSSDETREKAGEMLRSLIDEVRLIPENGRLEIELVGDLPAMLAFANDAPRRADPAGRITMVAGEGSCQYSPTLLIAC